MVKDYRRPGFRALTVGFSVQGSAAFLDFPEARVRRARRRDQLERRSQHRPRRDPDRRLAHRSQRSAAAVAGQAVLGPLLRPGYGRLLRQGRRRRGGLGHQARRRALRRPGRDRPRSGWERLVHRHAPRRPADSRGPSLHHAVRHHRWRRRGHGVRQGCVRRDRARACSGRRWESDARGDADRRLGDRALGRQRASGRRGRATCISMCRTSTLAYRRALAAGASSLYEPMDQPYGDRECGVIDAGGNYWFIATHLS